MMFCGASVLFVLTVVSAVRGQYGFMDPPRSGPTKATCTISNGDVQGVVYLSQMSVVAPVTIKGSISGLAAGAHGFHVHQYGDLSEGCKSAGGHYNPFNKQHGAPEDQERHVGDLGNIMADNNGVATVDITDGHMRLCGPASIMGRAIVVHEKADDLGRGGNAESKKTGNAGARVGCCVIGSAPAS